MGARKSISIKELAALAGVSVGTVDRVIHQRGRVSDETRDKVQKLVLETGYQPKKSKVQPLRIGVLLPVPSSNPYWELPLEGVRERAKFLENDGVSLTEFLYDYHSEEDFTSKGEAMLNAAVDGLIIHPIFRQATYQLVRNVRANNLPFVFLDVNLPELEPMYFVGQDAKSCGGLAGRLLSLGLGEEDRVWVINFSSASANSTSFLREIGAVDTLRENQLKNEQIRMLDFKRGTDEQKLQAQIKAEIEANGAPSRVYVTNSRVKRIFDGLRACGQTQKILIIGHDPLPENIKLLQDGDIDFLIAQDSKRQGALALEGLHIHLTDRVLFEKESHICSMVYSKENINSIRYFH